jgi:hypothetical protein
MWKWLKSLDSLLLSIFTLHGLYIYNFSTSVYTFDQLRYKNKSYRNDNMTLTCGVLNVSMVSDDTYLWSVECFNGFSGLHINNNSLYNDNMTLTCGVLNVSMVSAVSISTTIPWYDTYLWSVECFYGFSGLHINNNSLIWHLLVECWMFQWFQMTLTCGVLNVSMVSAVSISTIIPCTMIIWHLLVECWMFQWFQRSPYQQ